MKHNRTQSGIRQKLIHCGPYAVKTKFIEIDLFPYWDSGKKSGRKEKRYESEPKQKDLNDKNSKRYFNQLAKSNFTEEDLIVGLTFKPKFAPASEEEAKKEFENYAKRINRARKKIGLPPMKYLVVMETTRKGKYHFHMFMEGGLDRDLVEELWSRPKKKGEKKRERLGRVNSQRIQPDENFCEALTTYLVKDPKGKKRWSGSRNNLQRPWVTSNDNKYSRSQIDKLAQMPRDCEYIKQFFERQYEGYELTECKQVFNKETARWSIYLKMRLKGDIWPIKKQKEKAGKANVKNYENAGRRTVPGRSSPAGQSCIDSSGHTVNSRHGTSVDSGRN